MNHTCLHCNKHSFNLENYDISCDYCWTTNYDNDGVIGYVCIKCYKEVTGVMAKCREEHAKEYHRSVDLV